MTAFPMSQDLSTICSTSAAGAEPFVDLINAVKTEWAAMNDDMQNPMDCIARLHLETLALVRGLHCNVNPSWTANQEAGPSSYMRQVQAMHARSGARARALAVEPLMHDMREHVSQILAKSQMLAQAAISIEDELDSFASHIDTVKQESWQDQRRAPPPPMSAASSSSEESEQDGPDHDGASRSDSDEPHEVTTPGLEDPQSAREDYFGAWSPSSPEKVGVVHSRKRSRTHSDVTSDSDADEEGAMAARCVGSRKPRHRQPVAAPMKLLRAQSMALFGAAEMSKKEAGWVDPADEES